LVVIAESEEIQEERGEARQTICRLFVEISHHRLKQTLLQKVAKDPE